MKCSFVSLVILVQSAILVLASNGDREPFFKHCIASCEKSNCTDDGYSMQDHAEIYYQQTVFDKLLSWRCRDECQYACMWKTVEVYHMHNVGTPQFYGKWPFQRFLGLQEPASVLFSIINFMAHAYNLGRFRREVRPDSPCYKIRMAFGYTSLNCWLWSTVFHARDFPITEMLDYTSAYAVVLMGLYTWAIRMIHRRSLILQGSITIVFLSFYLNYFAYLSLGRFSYSFNMKTNIVTGFLSGVGWIVWSLLVRKRRPYYKKILLFYIVISVSMLFEIFEFPPLFWTFDAHSLWHLSTIPVAFLLYPFLIEDCKALRKEKVLGIGKFNKEI